MFLSRCHAERGRATDRTTVHAAPRQPDRASGQRDCVRAIRSERAHWTDKPYHWHVNDGAEVFVVLGGSVEMRWREHGDERRVVLEAGDLFVAETGDEHVASPIGQARVLVIEKKGSD
jgi:mannose-6-phosphate isomerase-like protein (cupin superfamily)